MRYLLTYSDTQGNSVTARRLIDDNELRLLCQSIAGDNKLPGFDERVAKYQQRLQRGRTVLYSAGRISSDLISVV